MEDEKVITAGDVLEWVAVLILAVAGIVALFALIWAAWHTFRVALTIIVCDLILIAGGLWIGDKLKRKC